MFRFPSVLPALKRNFASTRRSMVLVFAVAALFCAAPQPQAHAAVFTCSTMSSAGAALSGAPANTTVPVSLVLGDVITFSGSASISQDISGGAPGSGILLSPGSYTIIAGYGGTGTYNFEVINPGTVSLSCAAPVNYVVTSTADDDGAFYASNCTATTATTGTGATGTSCTLRDALLSVANNTLVSSTSPSAIYFLPSLAGTGGTTPFTITLANGNLTVPSYTTINGLTTGSDATLTNLVTVQQTGANASTFYTAGIASATYGLNNLNITGGGDSGIEFVGGSLTVNQCYIYSNSNTSGGGIIDHQGTLTLTNSTVANNTATSTLLGLGHGGGIDLVSGVVGSAVATLINDTITGNTATQEGGGIAIDSGSMDISNSTIYGNTATTLGGGIYINNAAGSLVFNDTIIAGNASSGGYPDLDGLYTSQGGNIVNNSSITVNTGVTLAPLGNYGGPTPTMAEMPSSQSICAGVTTVPPTTDQRGAARTTTYTSSCTDVGADQAHYGIGFITQPASTYVQNVNFGNTTAPVVSMEDDGYPIPYADPTADVIINDEYAGVAGFDSTNLSSGSATFSGAYITSPETTDYLTSGARVTVYGQGLQNYTAANSNTFSVTAPVAGFSVSTLSGVSAGTAQNITITALSSLSPATTATGFTGTVTVTSTDAAATINGVTIGTGTTLTFISANNGVLTFTVNNGIVFKTAGSQTVTITYTTVTGTSNSVTITAAAAASISAATGSGQSATIGAAFTNPLVVQVLDAYSNPVGGNVVTFTPPSTGASATLSNSSTCTTSVSHTPSGSCSVTATANGISNSATSYSVTAKATGITTPATFMLTNTQATITLTVTASPATLVYGEPVTITATSSQLNVGGSTPAGAVTFYDNSTALSPTGTLAGSFTSASYNTFAQLGSQQYGASLAADTNFNAVARTNTTAIVVGKASSTLTGPTTQPVQITVNAGGSVPVSVTGQYSGTGVSTPSGSISYTIGSPCSASCTGTATITSGAATIPTPSTLAPGPYTVAVTYAGDTNYNAATGINVSIQVGQLTPTVTYPAQTAITYGTTLVNNLNATTAYNTTPLTSGGTMVYSAAVQLPLGGVPPLSFQVNASTVLTPGTYTLTALWTPNSTNSALYKSASNTTTLVVNQATPGDTLQASANSILTQNQETLTATISFGAGTTPTGSVNFMDGLTLLSTVPLTNGVAVLNTSTLSVGSHSITAVYSGDSNYLTVTSAAQSITVLDFSLAISTTAGSITAVTVVPGATATYQLTISPVGASTFPATVNLTATGLPAGATYTITPSSITAGSGATTVTLTIVTSATNAQNRNHPAGFGRELAPVTLALLLLPFSRRLRRRAGKLGRLAAMLLVLLGGAITMAGLSGCGGGTSGFFTQPVSSSTVTVTGTSGTLTHSTTVTLTIE